MDGGMLMASSFVGAELSPARSSNLGTVWGWLDSFMEPEWQNQGQAEQERSNPLGHGPSTHGQGIEPRHLLIGVALGGVEPHLDAAATAPAVVAELVGVTPEALTQGCRRGEVELKCATGGPSWALVRSCRGREGRHGHSAPGPKTHFWPPLEILAQPQIFKPPFCILHLHPPTLRPSPEVQFQPFCQLVLQV